MTAARRRARRIPAAVARARLHRAIAREPRATFDRPRVFYGYERVGRSGRPPEAGMVKFERLAAVFPNAPLDFNIFYTGSSSLPPDLGRLLELARARGARVVWNQDGVVYPGLGWNMERANGPMALALHEADHVFFQSEFCKLSADRFLGPRSGPWEVLYNAVDTRTFAPAVSRPAGLVLLLGGNQYQWYRLESALRAAALVARERDDVTLLVSGSLSWSGDRAANEARAGVLMRELGIERRVVLTGPYAQDDAPALFRRAHLLLHTKYNDPCPNTVLEAMACGLPVVYSASGGVPELVGAEAGVGVPAPLDFERDHPPDPEALAAAVLSVAGRLDEFAAAARARAVERFDLAPWVERHRQTFEELLDGAAGRA